MFGRVNLGGKSSGSTGKIEAEGRLIVTAGRAQPAHLGLYIRIVAILWFVTTLPLSVMAAPYAAMVVDARSGEVLHSRSADTRLHPASLTKMMTLYVAFEAVQNGEISMDSMVRISKKSANESPSKLGLRAGSEIKLRYLVRAAAVKSANDAATAIAEAISGSEAAFARRMNRTARALGMTRTTFKNAHGLTEKGHLSTARDMTTLGRRLFYDYPQYYNLFSRRSTNAKLATVSNTNRRFLNAYDGADGIKTGYTSAAGFNLVASAERGNKRIIATLFGGKSTQSRNERVAELLDMGFRRAPSHVRVKKPALPTDAPSDKAQATGDQVVDHTAIKSERPKFRPQVLVEQNSLLGPEVEQNPSGPQSGEVEQSDIKIALSAAQSQTSLFSRQNIASALEAANNEPALSRRPERTIVSRRSGDLNERHWGVNIGNYSSRRQAESMLLKMALTEVATLDTSERKVLRKPKGYDATFTGLTREGADLACRRLQAYGTRCFTIGPGG